MEIFYPIQVFADLITYKLFALSSGSHLGGALNFFLSFPISAVFYRERVV